MITKEHNGWTNYETWVVNLWMDNEEDSQRFWTEQAQETFDASDHDTEQATHDLADYLQTYHEDEDVFAIHKLANGTVFADLIGAALQAVNWHEIAASLLSDVAQPEQEEEEI